VSTGELIFISDAARMLDMHPQTLRKYERLGLVRPARTVGSMRLYSRDEIERLRFIKRLVDESGVNLAGVQQLLSVAEAMQRIRPLMQSAALQRDSTRRRLLREMDQLAELLGLTFDDDLFDSDRARDPRSGRGR
jgi:MerR family transcriptional regulator/heat shock protein HspR